MEAVADTLAFDTIDPGVLAKRLELSRNGEQRGRANIPAAEAKTFDSVEHTILTEIEGYRRKAVDRVTRSIEASDRRLRAFDFEQGRLDIIAAINVAKVNFLAEVNQGADELYQKRRAVIDATKDLLRFKLKHEIERQAHLPENRLWASGIVALIFLIELALNASFFAGGLDGGFIEAFAVAAGIAALNVGVGFGIGLTAVRLLFYRNIFVRTAALIVLIVDIGLCTALNLAAALFRTALMSDDPATTLASAFKGPPLELLHRLTEINGFQSFILVGLGFLFHLGATADGFKFDDPYPLYGKYWRKREEAEIDYTESKIELITTLTQERDETVTEMKNVSGFLSSSRRIAARIGDGRASARSRFDTYLDGLERIANQLLTLYRESNRTNRETPAPEYFGAGWVFPNRQLGGSVTSNAATFPDDDIAKRTQDDLEKGIVDITNSYIEAVRTYAKIESMVEEDLPNGG